MNLRTVGENLGFSVKPLSETNLAEICQINSETNAASWSREQFLEELRHSDSLNLGLFDDTDQLNGFIFVRLITIKDQSSLIGANCQRYEVELLVIAVTERKQNQGIGEILLSSLINIVGANNITAIFLEVRAKNFPALKFYKKFGFSIILMRKNYYREPVDDALVMSIRFSEGVPEAKT